MIVVWCSDPKDAKEHLSKVFALEGIATRYVPFTKPPNADSEGDVLLVCGSRGLDFFKQKGIVHKSRKLGSVRGKTHTSPGGVLTLFTFDPRLRLREADKAEEILWDARLTVRLHETGTTEPTIGEYKWGTLKQVQALVKAELADRDFVPVALDLETMGRYPWYEDKHVVTSQWTVGRAGHSIVVKHLIGLPDTPTPEWDLEALECLLNHDGVRLWGANLKFDLVWLAARTGVHCTNFTFDTLLGGSIVNENRSNSLDWHGRVYTTIGGYEKAFNGISPPGTKKVEHHKGHMEKYTEHPLFLQYAGGDTDATFQSAVAIRKELWEQPALARFYQKILHPACRVFERIEERGLLADPKEFRKLEVEVSDAITEHMEAAVGALPLAVRAKHAEDLRLSRPTVLRDAFFSPEGWNLKPIDRTGKTKQPSTAFDHLKKFSGVKGVDNFLQHFKAMKVAEKTLSTYILGFMKHLRPDGYFHPTYALYRGGLWGEGEEDSGTVTGRLAAKDPAIQTLPKHTQWAKALRRAYPAPPGYLFWQMDFSQGELRVMACLANELNMIEAYRQGIDLHAKTAAQLNDVSLEEFLSWKKHEDAALRQKYALLRQGGKAGNFGLLYGMSAKGFVTYAYNSYGVVVELKKAQEFREQFIHELYPALGQYHESQIEYAKRHLQVESPLGRIRHLPLVNANENEVSAQAERQAINAPTQTTLNDIGLWAAVHLDQEFEGEEDLLTMRGSTHDALYGYVREDSWQETLRRADARVTSSIELLPKEFDWEPQLSFPVDWEIGPSWAKLEEIQLAA